MSDVSFNMVIVEGGSFTMGATSEQGSGANNWEKQPHKVNLATYSIGQTEVTQELWCAIKGNNPCDSPSDLKLPIGGVNWDACQVFLGIIKFRQEKGSFLFPACSPPCVAVGD